MNLEENILFNFPKIYKIGNNKFVSNRKVNNIISDIIYFYNPKKIIIKNNKIKFFINNEKIKIISTFLIN
jgi:hypothetical protein